MLDGHVPPLRDRRSDLSLLFNHFFRKFVGEAGELRMGPAAWAALMRHSFPGNVSELEHAVHHAVVMSQGGTIGVEHLPAEIGGRGAPAVETESRMRPLAESMKNFERQRLLLALNATDGVEFKAAQLLRISRKALWEKLKLHHITSSARRNRRATALEAADVRRSHLGDLEGRCAARHDPGGQAVLR